MYFFASYFFFFFGKWIGRLIFGALIFFYILELQYIIMKRKNTFEIQACEYHVSSIAFELPKAFQ